MPNKAHRKRYLRPDAVLMQKQQNEVNNVAGGWQGLDFEHLEADNSLLDKLLCCKCFDFSGRFPRLAAFVYYIWIPLLVLLFITGTCGHFLAFLESQSEIDSNDSALSDFRNKTNSIVTIIPTIQGAYNTCISQLAEESSGTVDLAVLQEYLDTCTSDAIKEANNTANDRINRDYEETISNSLSIEWIRCKNKTSGILPHEQVNFYAKKWEESSDEIREHYEAQGKTPDEAFQLSIAEATGGDHCDTNSPGGAMFWFTIMTTIGYGNTAPVTSGGKAMVYTLGFVTILGFTAIMGTSGTVILNIVDEFLLEKKLDFLTQGIPSIALWFGCLWGWIIVTAGFAVQYSHSRVYGTLSFAEAVWLAYISITTVGFGDYHIPHQVFRWGDLFYIPLIMLIGFVFLANFLLKLSRYIVSSRKIIKQRRREAKKARASQASPTTDKVKGRGIVSGEEGKELVETDDNGTGEFRDKVEEFEGNDKRSILEGGTGPGDTEEHII